MDHTKRPTAKRGRKPSITTLQRRFSKLVAEYIACTGSAYEHMAIQESISETRRQIEAHVRRFVQTARVAA